MVLTIVAAFLNPVLRLSPDDPVTLFRIVFPAIAIALIIRTIFQPETALFLLNLAAFTGYSILQLVAHNATRDGYMLAYFINIATLLLFLHFIANFARGHGTTKLHDVLYWWFVLIMALSIGQLLTGLPFPNAPFRQGVARIYFGQENDASVAIAAFLPLMFWRSRWRLFSVLLLTAAIYVLYVNGTRTVLIAIAAYPLLLGYAFLGNWLKRAYGVPWRISLPLPIVLSIAFAYAIQDAEIKFADHSTSLNEMLFTPIWEILAGRDLRDAETSINVRITLIVAAFKAWLTTLGFGLGPGGTTHVVALYYPRDYVRSMHSFPLQVLFEHGWFLIASIAFFIWRFADELDWRRFFPYAIYLLLAVSSATSGLITNYYFFACTVWSLYVYSSHRD